MALKYLCVGVSLSSSMPLKMKSWRLGMLEHTTSYLFFLGSLNGNLALILTCKNNRTLGMVSVHLYWLLKRQRKEISVHAEVISSTQSPHTKQPLQWNYLLHPLPHIFHHLVNTLNLNTHLHHIILQPKTLTFWYLLISHLSHLQTL